MATLPVNPFASGAALSTAPPQLQPQAEKAAWPWYAIRTRSKCERLATTALENNGYESYLPVYRSRRRWSDRVVSIDAPLFPGYVFCRFNSQHRLPVITSPGVVDIIGFANEPAPIPDQEIEAVQTVLNSGLAAEPFPFLREGQRVRVTHGALKDVEGILVKKKADWRLVVSVEILQRSVSVEFDGDCVTHL